MRLEAILVRKYSNDNRAELKLKESSLNNKPIMNIPLNIVQDFALGSELWITIEDNIIKKVELKIFSKEEIWQESYNEILSILKDIRYKRD